MKMRRTATIKTLITAENHHKDDLAMIDMPVRVTVGRIFYPIQTGAIQSKVSFIREARMRATQRR